MDFRSTLVKDMFENPQAVAIMKELAPQLLKFPRFAINKKTCGEIFDLVVSKKIVPENIAREIEAKINAIL